MLLGNECCCLSAEKRSAATEGFIKTLKKQERQVLFWKRPIIYQRQKIYFYDYIVVISLSNDKRIVLYQLSD